MADRISSLDSGYQTGELSIFPQALDDRETLFEARNNAETKLKHSLSYSSRLIVVEDASAFPPRGQLRIGPAPGEAGQYELVYYDKKTRDTFQGVKRGFAGSFPNHWPAGKTWVTNAVHAEHHNAIKDALINMEVDCGLKLEPDPLSLNGILKRQEVRFLTPKPIFRAYPIKGKPPLKVRFQNFTTGYIGRYLWDFGDGGTSLEESPIHTYLKEGKYTVKLNVTSTFGGQGVVTKSEYIEVNIDESMPFFYVDSVSDPYSVATATAESRTPKTFLFVDQSDGDIVQRNWIFGDGNSLTQEDPDIHTASHVYEEPGEYIVTQLIVFANGRLKRVELPDPLVVL